MTIAVLITRPDPSGLELADQLRNRWGCGIEMIVSPVTEIVFLDELPDLEDSQSLIFTSQNGVVAFTRLSDRRDIPCYAVGPATSEHAKRAGFQVSQSNGDANMLIDHIVAHPPPGLMMHIRGAHVSMDIAQMLSDEGLRTHASVLYEQEKRALTSDAIAGLRRGTPVILPLYSPRSAKLVFNDVRPDAPLLIAAISENVAEIVPEGVAKRVLTATQPNAEAMLAAMDVLLEEAKRLEGTYRAQ